jgi:REP element-mobilizing transposase RayT
MSVKYKFSNPEGLYFITFATVNWTDVFTRNIYKDILINSLKHCIEYKGLEVYAYTIMTNHVHLIAASSGKEKMEHIMRDMKKFTAYEIINTIKENRQESRREWLLEIFEKAGRANSNNTKYQFWQQDNHPIELQTNDMIEQRLNYIHNNAVEAGIVYEPHHYVYSSAAQYAGKETGLLPIKFLY